MRERDALVFRNAAPPRLKHSFENKLYGTYLFFFCFFFWFSFWFFFVFFLFFRDANAARARRKRAVQIFPGCSFPEKPFP